MYQRFTMLRGHWHIIALRECSGISAQVVVDWERVTEETECFPIYTYHPTSFGAALLTHFACFACFPFLF